VFCLHVVCTHPSFDAAGIEVASLVEIGNAEQKKQQRALYVSDFQRSHFSAMRAYGVYCQ